MWDNYKLFDRMSEYFRRNFGG